MCQYVCVVGIENVIYIYKSGNDVLVLIMHMHSRFRPIICEAEPWSGQCRDVVDGEGSTPSCSGWPDFHTKAFHTHA